MTQRPFSKLFVAAGAAAALATSALPRPAVADTTSTLNTALAAAVLVGGIVLYNNYEHKRLAANTIVGYTGNGGTVYADGRVVMPDGTTYYPNSNGQYAYNGYDGGGYNGPYNGYNGYSSVRSSAGTRPYAYDNATHRDDGDRSAGRGVRDDRRR
ncbi:MAG: hypothetical protein JOZ24_08100 [Candidatus Eremiobacteraeota bacterium]|nr:hypothetical protein [Candidatus Eremiobacteraeota bacterium]